MNTCYNCGKPLDNKTKTAEHIPAKNLFVGYDHTFKTQRITVPGCESCNHEYSKYEDELRNLIGAINEDDDAKGEISAKTARGVLLKDPKMNRLYFNQDGKVEAVSFKANDIIKTHIKNFKGLYYNKYNKAIDEAKYNLEVHVVEDNGQKFMQMAQGYLEPNFSWDTSGHEKIFKYILQPYRDNLTETDKPDVKISDLETEPLFLAVMVYSESHTAVVSAVNNEFQKKQKERMGK